MSQNPRQHGLTIWHPPGFDDHPALIRLQDILAARRPEARAWTLVFAPSPRPALCRSIAAGQAPHAALQNLMDAVASLLASARAGGPPLLLLSPHMVLHRPGPLLERLDVEDGNRTQEEVSDDQPRDEPDPALDVIAGMLLTRAPALARMIGELEARAIDLTDGEALQEDTVGLATIEAIHAVYAENRTKTEQVEQYRHALDNRKAAEAVLLEQLRHAQKVADEKTSEINVLQADKVRRNEELPLLLAQISQFQEHSVETDSHVSDLEAENARLKDTVKEKNRKLHALSQRKKATEAARVEAVDTAKDRKAQIKQLEVRLHQLNQGLESYEALLREAQDGSDRTTEQIAELKKQIAHHKDIVQQRDQELSDLRRSLSYRVTAPLRAIRGALPYRRNR